MHLPADLYCPHGTQTYMRCHKCEIERLAYERQTAFMKLIEKQTAVLERLEERLGREEAV